MKIRDFFKNLGIGAVVAVPAKELARVNKFPDLPKEIWRERQYPNVGDMILFRPDRHPFHIAGRKKMDLVPVIIIEINGGVLTMGPCEDITPSLFKEDMNFVMLNAIYIQWGE